MAKTYVRQGATVTQEAMLEEPAKELPPAGPARRDELKRRQDVLEEEIDKLSAEMAAIDPKVLEPDQEIQHEIAFGGLEVSNQKKGFKYCWACNAANGTMIQRKKAEGWEVVMAGEPEAKEYLREDGTRRIGDTILMRTSEENYKRIEIRNEQVRLRQQLGVAAELDAMGAKYRDKGLIAHTDPNESPLLREVFGSRQAAIGVAGQTFDKMLRNGTVPGVPIK